MEVAPFQSLEAIGLRQFEVCFETTYISVFQGDDGLAVAAESCDFLQVAVGLRQGHYGAIAVDGVPGGGQIPPSARGVLFKLAGGPA
jgi:hypothetical protein